MCLVVFLCDEPFSACSVSVVSELRNVCGRKHGVLCESITCLNNGRFTIHNRQTEMQSLQINDK